MTTPPADAMLSEERLARIRREDHSLNAEALFAHIAAQAERTQLEPTGTFACPHCGLARPHTHTVEEIEDLGRANREAVDKLQGEVIALREQNRKTLDNHDKACDGWDKALADVKHLTADRATLVEALKLIVDADPYPEGIARAALDKVKA